MGDAKWAKAYAVFGVVGFVKITLIAGAAFLGRALDRHFDTFPWITMGLILVGIGIGFWWLIRTVNSFYKDD